MKGRKVNEYSKNNKNGQMQTNYVYEVSGTQEEIAKFLASQAAKTVAKEDGKNGVKKGANLLVTSSYLGESCELVITKAGRVTADTSKDRKMAAICSRFGTAGTKVLENYILNKLNGGGQDVPETPVEAPEKDLSLDGLN